uniref:Uncharacterized protein LOC102806247 n=1 Tax=Saccoglossus kowalevskii TaxID=10224 RepID=A0ABM0MJ98_SACKO
MKLDLILLTCFVILASFDNTESWRRRRRRRACGPSNCQVSGWNAWGACSAPCGTSGTQTRTRYVTVGQSCGGSCPYHMSESQGCNNPGCNGHGSPLTSSCSCVDEWWDTCCDKPCTAIANCQQLHCTSSTNQACHRCNYDRGGDIIAYQLLDYGGYPNRICEQRCSWRPDSQFCYPGQCTTTPSTCSCAPNFSGNNCLQMNTSPVMQYCLGTLIQTTGDYRADAECDDHVTAPTTVFTNIQPDRIQVEWHNSYTGPNAADWPQQFYVEDFKVGVISASYDWWVIRGGNNVKTGTVTCSIGYNQDNPHQAMHDCDVTGDIVFTFQHGDRFYFTAKARNGGYITIRNYDATSGYTINPKNYYTGIDVAHTADFTLDYQPPAHCTVTGSCSDNMLDRGPAITKIGDITVQYNGWHDDLSGILRYEYEVYKMQAYGDVLGYRSISPVLSGQVDLPATQFSIILSDPGVYCVMLTVDDVAGNHNRARRFLIFDDVNGVNTTDQFPIWVDSAAENTTHLWQTDLQDPSNTGPQVVMQWPGHFYNWFHREHKFLNAIEDNSPPLTSDYEEVTGQPPTTRSREAIPNINAIVRFEVNYGIDHQGGRTITSPTGNWQDVDDILVEQQGFDIPRNDGDSIHLWVRATDVMGNTNQDDVLIHVDSSPPEIHHISLMRHGQTQLAVHNSVDLYDMRVVFQTYDDHSGLHNIHWKLADMADGNVVHGEGQVAVRRPIVGNTTCDPPNCGCIQKNNECYYRDYAIELDANKLNLSTGNHDHDYIFTITVTNNAMLVDVKTFQVTVDTSPPHEGTVHDSRTGETDLDYQQDIQIFASWDGFFDRESGILFYVYIFGESCSEMQDGTFDIPITEPAINTTSTYAEWTAPDIGTYHCTVVAYNRALEPSNPVCSDGITIDTSPPTLSEIVIDDAIIKAGVIKDGDGNVWMVNTTRYRHQVVNVSDEC